MQLADWQPCDRCFRRRNRHGARAIRTSSPCRLKNTFYHRRVRSTEKTLPLECDKWTGIQALTTGEKALSHHLLTRAALAQHQARRFDRRRHINALEEKISLLGNTLETSVSGNIGREISIKNNSSLTSKIPVTDSPIHWWVLPVTRVRESLRHWAVSGPLDVGLEIVGKIRFPNSKKKTGENRKK